MARTAVDLRRKQKCATRRTGSVFTIQCLKPRHQILRKAFVPLCDRNVLWTVCRATGRIGVHASPTVTEFSRESGKFWWKYLGLQIYRSLIQTSKGLEGAHPFLFYVIFCASRPRMVVSHVVHPYSLESATTPAWIACGQTGWKPGVV